MMMSGVEATAVLGGFVVTVVILFVFVIQRRDEAKREKFEKRDW